MHCLFVRGWWSNESVDSLIDGLIDFVLKQKFFKAVDEADMKVDDDDDDDEVKTPTIVTGPPSLYR